MVLYAGGQDALADPKDVSTLMSHLSPQALVKKVEIPSYAHLDFTWGVDANTYVYKDLMQVLANRTGHGSMSRF